MPSTIVLAAVPAKFVRSNDTSAETLIIKPFGKKYGLAVHWVTSIREIKEAVGRFAEQIHSRFPDYSFAVTAKIRHGDPAPAGFENALRSGALGQHRYTRVFERCTPEEYLVDDFEHRAD